MRIPLCLYLVLTAVLLLAIAAAPVMAAAPYGEDPTIDWQQLLGGTSDDYGQSAQQTADGGYILVGYSRSINCGEGPITNHARNDVWVAKLNSAGGVQWQELLGGSGDDYGYSIRQTADGGYILVGKSDSSASGNVTDTNHGSSDMWVVKLDGAGGIQWQKLLGGSGNEIGRSIQLTADGGYIVLGSSDSSGSGDVMGTGHGNDDYWVVKLSSSGSIQWQKLLGGSSWDEGYSVQQTADRGYILLGQSDSSASGDLTDTTHGSPDVWVVKLSSSGSIQWQKLLGGSSWDEGYSVQETADGGYILLGSSESSVSGDVTDTNHGGWDYWVIKLSSTGVIQWQTLLGGSGNDAGRSIRQTADGGYILLGSSDSSESGDITGSNHGNHDFWVVKLSATGAIQWQRLLGGIRYEEGSSVQQTADGGYILLGHSSSSESGDVTGTNHVAFGYYDCWVVKLKMIPGIRLDPGWNFVSVPAVLAPGNDTAAIFAGVNTDGHSIFLFNATAKTWTAMASTTKVKVLDGIWIYAKTATTVPLSYDTNPLAMPPEKSLVAGWNTIGYSSVQPMTAKDTLASVALKWSTLFGFDEAAQRYETSIINGGSGASSDSREILPGKGYWLDMREAGRISAVGADP